MRENANKMRQSKYDLGILTDTQRQGESKDDCQGKYDDRVRQCIYDRLRENQTDQSRRSVGARLSQRKSDRDSKEDREIANMTARQDKC